MNSMCSIDSIQFNQKEREKNQTKRILHIFFYFPQFLCAFLCWMLLLLFFVCLFVCCLPLTFQNIAAFYIAGGDSCEWQCHHCLSLCVYVCVCCSVLSFSFFHDLILPILLPSLEFIMCVYVCVQTEQLSNHRLSFKVFFWKQQKHYQIELIPNPIPIQINDFFVQSSIHQWWSSWWWYLMMVDS